MMERERYNCLVIDDEPIARKIIVNYIGQMPVLQLAGECINALSGIDYLRSHPSVDIVFLDINMPNLSGIQMLKITQPVQPIIFTTAYSEFAVESYELNAVDYLLKPFSFERFTKAAYKAIDAVRGKSIVQGTPPENRQVFIKSEGKNYPVLLDDILYCEAMKNYTKIVLNGGKKLMPLISLSRMESMLAEAGGDFIQIHRSFLISRRHIKAVRANSVFIDAFEIPIGVQYKEGFFKSIGLKGDE